MYKYLYSAQSKWHTRKRYNEENAMASSYIYNETNMFLLLHEVKLIKIEWYKLYCSSQSSVAWEQQTIGPSTLQLW